jgi:RNA polymerase sigma factor (sigma-70 family)
MSMTASVQLLRDYAERDDEAAFGELVARYIDLVYSTAVRRVGGDADLARDVAQTVFADLARKARSLRGEVMLGGWLHRHTGFVSASLVRSERRRQARERQAAEMNTLDNSPDPAWQQLAPALDETIDALDAPDRQAIVLRFYEHRDFRSVGAALGLSDDAAQKRVSRALGKLRALLANRGVTLSIAALAGLMAAQAVTAAPTPLAAAVRQAALVGAASGAGTTLSLAKLTSWLAVKWALSITVVASVAIGLLMARHPSTTPATANGPGVAGQAATSVSPAGGSGANPDALAAAAPTAANDQLVLHIVAADTGKPVARATIERVIFQKGSSRPAPGTTMKLTSTDLGVCQVPLPSEPPSLLVIQSRTDGFADTSLEWRPGRGEEIPLLYTLRLPRSVPIGGRVVDQDDKPVSGAEVRISSRGDTSPGVPHITAQAGEKTITDAEGRWGIDRFAAETISSKEGSSTRLGTFQAVHPDYFEDPPFSFGGGPPRGVQTQLLAGACVFRLAHSVAVRGTVVDTNGQPVSNVRIAKSGLRPHSGSDGMTNQSDGTFAMAGCRAGTNLISFEAAGFAMKRLELDLEPEMAPLRVTLQPAKPLRLRIMDRNALPVPLATVSCKTFSSVASGIALGRPGRELPAKRPTLLFNQQTDAEGRVRWESPPEGKLFLDIAAAGLRSTNVSLEADGDEHVITLAPALTISGSVSDAATGEPIPHFSMSVGTRALWSGSLDFNDGKFRHVEENAKSGTLRFKFEAEGYVPFVTREVQADAGEAQLDIKMQAAAAITVTLLQPEGAPATNADIGFVAPGGHLTVVEGGLRHFGRSNSREQTSTDDQGRFTLPPNEDGTWVVAAAPEGYAAATAAALTAEPTMRLLPWGRVEGTFVSGGKPAAGSSLSLSSSSPVTETTYAVEADENGHFTFPKVPPGNLTLSKKIWIGAHPGRLSGLAEVAIRPGETKTMAVGTYTVTARLCWPEDTKREADWIVSAYCLQTETAGPTPPGHSLAETADGALVAEDLIAGSYLVKVHIGGPPGSDGRLKTLLEAEAPFTVPAEPPSGTLDLGEIVLQPVH